MTRKAFKRFCRLPVSVQDLIDLAVVDLEDQGPRPSGWNVRKTGTDEFRPRLNYRYRMRYRIQDQGLQIIEVFSVGHRKDAYR